MYVHVVYFGNSSHSKGRLATIITYFKFWCRSGRILHPFELELSFDAGQGVAPQPFVEILKFDAGWHGGNDIGTGEKSV